MNNSFWQTITLAPVKNRASKDEPKYYMADVNPEKTTPPGTPLYFKNRIDLILLAFGILGFCVYPKQIWLEIKAKLPEQ